MGACICLRQVHTYNQHRYYYLHAVGGYGAKPSLVSLHTAALLKLTSYA